MEEISQNTDKVSNADESGYAEVKYVTSQWLESKCSIGMRTVATCLRYIALVIGRLSRNFAEIPDFIKIPI